MVVFPKFIKHFFSQIYFRKYGNYMFTSRYPWERLSELEIILFNCTFILKFFVTGEIPHFILSKLSLSINTTFQFYFTGTVSATLCPRGTQRNQTTGAAESDCWPCDPGYYCDSEGMLGPTGVCDARYYCPDSAKIDSAMPTSYECPPGYYCPAGTGTPVACPPGMFYCIFLLPCRIRHTCCMPSRYVLLYFIISTKQIEFF